MKTTLVVLPSMEVIAEVLERTFSNIKSQLWFEIR